MNEEEEVWMCDGNGGAVPQKHNTESNAEGE